jgi:hypothetical protein
VQLLQPVVEHLKERLKHGGKGAEEAAALGGCLGRGVSRRGGGVGRRAGGTSHRIRGVAQEEEGCAEMRRQAVEGRRGRIRGVLQLRTHRHRTTSCCTLMRNCSQIKRWHTDVNIKAAAR